MWRMFSSENLISISSWLTLVGLVYFLGSSTLDSFREGNESASFLSFPTI